MPQEDLAAEALPERARRAIRALLDLGLSQKEIAYAIQNRHAIQNHLDTPVSQGYISKAANGKLDSVSLEVVVQLEAMLSTRQLGRIRGLLAGLKPRFLDACATPDVSLATVAPQIEAALVDGLAQTLIGGAAPCLPPGVTAIVAEIPGTPYILIQIQAEPNSDERNKLLAHELEHIVDRLRYKRAGGGHPDQSASALPKSGF